MPLATLVFRCVSYFPKRAEARARYFLLQNAVQSTHAHLDATTALDMRAKLLRLLCSQLAEMARAHDEGFSPRYRSRSGGCRDSLCPRRDRGRRRHRGHTQAFHLAGP